MKNIVFKILYILIIGIVSINSSNAQLMHLKGNITVHLNNGAIMQVNGGLRIDAGATLSHNTGSVSYLNVSGKFVLYGTYTQNANGRITFNKGAIDTIAGNSTVTIARVYIDKTGSNRVVLDPATDLSITDYLMLLNSSLELVNSDLLLQSWAKIYSSVSLDTALNTFNANKCIINSGSSSDPLLGGRVIRLFPNTLSLPQDFIFPIGTPGYYSPARITLRASGATFSTSPEISIKPVDKEHPKVEVNNKSLFKYWVVDTKDITMNTNGANVEFYYNAGEVTGNESNYKVLLYAPSYNNSAGYWRVDPGNDNDIVDFSLKFFYSIKVDTIQGDWLAGEPDVSEATYYSRQNGDWDDPNTWSKVNFGGPASTTIPNKLSDRVRIKDDTVTIVAAPAAVKLISVEGGTNPGKLIITGNYALQGDSTIIEDGAVLAFQHQDGISALPSTAGCIKTNKRSLSSNAIYEFIGSGNQKSGNGLPNIVKEIRIKKNSIIDTVKLEKNIAISNTLLINEGALDVSSYSIDGTTAGRTLTMNGGELILRSNFPLNYTAPTFSAGKVTFDGTGNSIIPSSASSPAVNQYFKLKIAGNTRSGNITFPNSGEIRIKDSLDISALNFTNNTYKFLTDGSTVVFNKLGGNQYIPLKPASPSDSLVNLEYFNLIIDSSGTKQFISTGSPTFKVLNNLTLRNNSTFNVNNYNLEVQGNWTNQSGAIFQPGTASVIMRSAVTLTTKSITSRDTTDNPFNNLVIAGPGIVETLDDIKVSGNLRIDTTSNFKLNTFRMSLYGNWINNGGTHQVSTSTVKFNNNTTQNIIHSSNNEQFYNLVVNNNQSVNATTVGGASNGIIINNDLILENGNLITHSGSTYRYATVLGNLTRPGGGFVDGELRKTVGTGATTVTFEVGHNKSYTPVTIQTTGSGGTSGLLAVLSDTLGVGSTPISWVDATPTDISPSGHTLSLTKHIARQYSIKIPTGSSFNLGPLREYNVTVDFIPGAWPSGDIRNSADYTQFTGRLRSGSNWITPFYYGTKPVVGTLTSSTFQYTQLTDFGTLLVGEPGIITYYSRANGNWESASNWSLQGYGGVPASSYPGELSNNYRAFIGNGNTITLTSNKTITNTASDSSLVVVDSSGTLNFQNFIIDGNGAFRALKFSTLVIGSSDGISSTGATGNVQTGTRNYNYGSHNRGTFIYNSNIGQNTGNGLPSGTDTVYKLIIDKNNSTLTLNTPSFINVFDSLWIKNGNFNLGSRDVYIFKSLRQGPSASFQPSNRTVFLRGNNQIHLRSDSYNNLLQFYNLDVSKVLNSGQIVLDTLTTVNIQNNLNFTNTNKAIIDATQYSSSTHPLYVRFDNNATVTGAGHINSSLNGGWIFGEVRKNIPSGDAPAVRFETGTATHYTPYTVDFYAGSGSLAGYLSCKAIAGNHPKLYSSPSSLYPINPSRNITVYWKLKKPINSTFERGNRNANFRVDFVNPDLATNTDCFGCADLAFYRGGDSLQWWQTMALNGTGENANNTSGVCGDTRFPPHPTPNFSYNGDPCNSTNPVVYIQVNNVPPTASFGDEEIYANGDTLLADFVAGNRNSVKYYNFYSINDGDWSDPNTWSTVSYFSTVNAAASDPDSLIRPVPMRQYDNVYIGNGKKVKLDIFVGTNQLSGDPNYNGFAGPSVFVEETGTLDLSTSVLRGNQFNAKKGSTLIIGSNDGIVNNVTSNVGNVQMANYGSGPTYSDSINVIYSPNGRTINRQTLPLNNRNSMTHFIETVTIRRASDNAIMLQYSSGNSFRKPTFGHIRALKSCTLLAGETYYIQINPSNQNVNRRYKGWFDYNYNFTFTDTGEPIFNVSSSDTTLVNSGNFTIPATTDQGTTILRIGMRGDNTDFTPTEGGAAAGEFEDYTIYIKNSNYVANQITNTGLPNIVSSFTVHSPNSWNTNPNVTLQKNITILDSLKFISGTLNQGSNTIYLLGDIVNDTLNAYRQQFGALNLIGPSNQYIRGTRNLTLKSANINKAGSGLVYQNVTTTIDSNLTFSSNNKWVVENGDSLIFSNPANVSLGSGSFSNNRMIEVDGSSTNSYVIKRFSPNNNYCTPSLSWTTGQHITSVTYGTLSNTSSLNTGYSDYTWLSPPTIAAGTATSINLSKSGGGNRNWYVWIDFNQNGVFEHPAENLVNTNTNSVSTSITIPTSALNGITRMRIKMRNGANTDPCESSTTEGEYEDYLINITNGTNPTGQTFAFTFNIGTNNQYNPLQTQLNSTRNSNPILAVQLRNQKHPNRLNDSILTKYWKVRTNGITNVIADSLRFTFSISDTTGNINKYIPARYNTTWEINLGSNPKVIPNDIVIKPTSLDLLSDLDGDWTAGIPTSFFNGRRFYSIANGNWNDPSRWSNISHTGSRSSYFPGDIYNSDTVHIDGHTITFTDSTLIIIDSLRIGGTNSNPGQGILLFGLLPSSKSLKTRQVFLDEDGLISGIAGTRSDSILIALDLRNNSTANQSLRNNNTSATHIKFYGTENSRIYGNGSYGRLGNFVLEKDGGLSDSLFIQSSNFALATDTTLNYLFNLNSGFLVYNLSNNLFLSTNGNDLNMGSNTGINILNGSVRTRASLTTNFNTIINVNGGDLFVGDGLDEGFYYNTGTTLNILNGNIQTAGVFGRANPTSLIDFNLSSNHYVKVNTVGNTVSSRIGFDISNSLSNFSMSNGRIIIANANGTTPSTADYKVSATLGSGMTGGTIQSGDSLLTPNGTTIKIAGTTPVYNLHFANSPAFSVTSQITENTFTIKNNWKIDSSHSFNLDGNTVKLAGNLLNYGNFSAVPTSATSNPWLIEVNGNSNQLLFSKNAPFELYKFSVNKSGGNVILADSGQSNLIIRNSLEFTTPNQAFIDASNTNRFVELSPNSFSTPSIFRVGLGHVFGRLYRHIPIGASITEYPVGADTITSYRPAIFQTVGTGGTAGLVGVRHYPVVHPDTSSAPFIPYQSIKKYWNVDDPSSFDLGSRKFNLTLQFINPGDLNGSLPNFFDMYLYNPPHPASGTWTELFTTLKTDTTTRSSNNDTFGDFTVAEPAGLTFYSYNSGDWDNINTWSLSGYTTLTVPTRIPNDKSDIVRIGNGKIVTLKDNYNDTVKTVIVERYNNLPGALYIEGQLNFIRGNTFILEDSCTLGIMHINGITPSGLSGAIQMNSRTFGVSRYIYNSNISATTTGLGLPDTVKSLIIDMQHPSFKTLFLSNAASPPVKIQDTLLIRQGEFSTNTRNVVIHKVIEVDSIVNNGRLLPGTNKFIFENNGTKNIVLKNRSGLFFYDVDIIGGTVKVNRPVAPTPDSSHIYINNNLNFAGTSGIFEINDNVNLVIKNANINSILNYGTNKFIRTTTSGGYLIRNINPSLSYVFPIGFNSDYRPATFDGLTGTPGYLGIRVQEGSLPSLAHIGSSGIPTSSFLKKYWSVDSVKLQINGRLRFFYQDSDVFGTETDMNNIGRWNPVREITPGSWAFPFSPPSIDYTNNYFETTTGFTYTGFSGDWALGSTNYFRRIFFSRQSGNWNDENSWTYNPTHSGPIFGTGMYPSFPTDSAVIGGGVSGVGNHTIILNISSPFSSPTNVGIALGTGTSNTGTLDLGNNILNGNRFTMGALSSLKIGNSNGITLVGSSTGGIQTDLVRNYSNQGLYYYTGNTNQVTGNGLPSQVNSLFIENTGTAPNNNVTLTASVDVSDSVSIKNGRLDIGLFNLNTTSLSAHFRLYNNATLAIGGNNDMLSAVNNFSTYNLGLNSFVEFYGNNQTISNLPTTFIQDFVSFTSGFGNVITTNSGTKIVASPILIRSNLYNQNSSQLTINSGLNSVRVLGTVENSATITNQGIIEIGN